MTKNIRMKKGFIFIAAFLFAGSVSGQPAADIANIEKLCGCFDVKFEYAETFSPDDEYEYHNRERISHARELVIPVEKTRKRWVLQHLLIVNDTMVIKHWREDWSFEDPMLFTYKGDQVWEKKRLPLRDVKGKWTQTVWEVSDAPRYQGVSEWVSTDGKTFWMNTTDAPLPRREYTKRKDYNILRRTNTIIVRDTGWVHDQDNAKIMRGDGKTELLVEEKGKNTYTRVNDSFCEAAKTYWANNKTYWESVRKVWDDYMAANEVVSLKILVDGKPLYAHLGLLEEEFARNGKDVSATESRIRDILDQFKKPSTSGQ